MDGFEWDRPKYLQVGPIKVRREFLVETFSGTTESSLVASVMIGVQSDHYMAHPGAFHESNEDSLSNPGFYATKHDSQCSCQYRL